MHKLPKSTDQFCDIEMLLRNNMFEIPIRDFRITQNGKEQKKTQITLEIQTSSNGVKLNVPIFALINNTVNLFEKSIRESNEIAGMKN